MSTQARPSIVVGVDGSADGLLALDWAVDLAARRGWRVRAVHVTEELVVLGPSPTTIPDDGTDVLEDAADELSRLGFTEATLEASTGHAAEVLLELSHDEPILVVGRRGTGGFAELMIGATSQVCATLARSTLVVVPDSWQPGYGERGQVVVGVDGSPGGQDAIGFAFESAAERGAELSLVHVPDLAENFPSPDLWLDPNDAPWRHSARVMVTEAVAGWADKYPDVVYRTHYRPGHPVEVLAKESDYADLLVVGGLGRSAFSPLRLGSVSRGVLHHANCPVAIVHGGFAV
ncbi:universal stress protein [Streptomyces sp. SID13031]|uniref:universal stress protein n=1 Tax=Streptomyces sp. SID13031 TaxID=2706046 RepID=UPI0013C7AE4C|nr:universal stress protein [Streptomyces sp. SID13031]NEA37603.1 universal stress protein [Streptomyces sp. SID13031]